MHDVGDIISNLEKIYDSNTAFTVLKDFERVIDELDLYVYKNWEDGELADGPKIGKHWVSCKFMWPRDKMPDPMGGKRLLDYDCKVKYEKTFVIKPRKIRSPDDMRMGTKKGKLDRHPVWIVEIRMPKSLVLDIYTGYKEQQDVDFEVPKEEGVPGQAQPADALAAPAPPPAPAPAPSPAPAPGGNV